MNSYCSQFLHFRWKFNWHAPFLARGTECREITHNGPPGQGSRCPHQKSSFITCWWGPEPEWNLCVCWEYYFANLIIKIVVKGLLNDIMLAWKMKLDFLHAMFSSWLCNNLKMFQTEKVNSLLFSGTCIKGEVHSSMAIFFTLKKVYTTICCSPKF